MIEKKDVIAAFLVGCCVMALLFAVLPIKSAKETGYDPWVDLNDDGVVDSTDLGMLGFAWGSFGEPITKAGLYYDSGWVDIRSMCGQRFSLEHDLGSTDVIVDMMGKESLDIIGGSIEWNKTYIGPIPAPPTTASLYSLAKTNDGGYALAGYSVTGSSPNQQTEDCLVKVDAYGHMLWRKTYGISFAPGARWNKAYSVIATSDSGYALAGQTYSGSVSGYDAYLVKTDSSGNMLWNKTYGGTSDDGLQSVVQTSDGGYAIAGSTYSFGAGRTDFYLVKTDGTGNMLWNKTYGGTAYDWSSSVVQTTDGGFGLGGTYKSIDLLNESMELVRTDPSGNLLWNQTYGTYAGTSSILETGDGGFALAGNTVSSLTSTDFWLVKTYANGNMQWNQTYGGTQDDTAYSLVQTSDGGYALAGESGSFGVYGSWLVKTDGNGIMQWNKLYSSDVLSPARSIVQTADGGYVLAGDNSYFGFTNFGLLRTDNVGNMIWSRVYGLANRNKAYSLVQASDGGYTMAGYTNLTDTGISDFCLAKTDLAGNMQWQKKYGGVNSDIAHSVVRTSDGGYAMAGYTDSFGAGLDDFYLVKTDSNGNMQWNKTYGAANNERAFSLIQTKDGGYAMAGLTESYGAGNRDFWLVKVDSTGSLEWSSTYGGTGDDLPCSLVQTTDAGYAVAGYTDSFGAGLDDFYLVKTDSNGNMQWNKTYGGAGEEFASSMIVTGDGQFVLAGCSNSSGSGGCDSWLVVVDSAGNIQWKRLYGGTTDDVICCVIQTSDDGLAMAGYTAMSSSGSTNEFWLVKISEQIEANLTHQKDIGGTDYETGWNSVIQEPSGAPKGIAYSVIQTSDGSYLLAGSTNSYGSGGFDFYLVKTNWAGVVLWNQTYGTQYDDNATSMIQTDDYGYALAGYTNTSVISKGIDIWLVKTDVGGEMLWNKTFTGNGTDQAYSIVQTSDGGYALAGCSNSQGTAGGYDFCVIKVDANGVQRWRKFYGGTGDDNATCIITTNDGGFVVAGYSKSPGTSGFWLVKIDGQGIMEWNKTYGGSSSRAYSVIQTRDGGYALAGTDGGFLLVKTDEAGNMEWSQTYRTGSSAVAYSLVQTEDCGYALTGYTSPGSPGHCDAWLVRTDLSGTMMWNQTYGGTDDDVAYSQACTRDGAFILAGYTKSYGVQGSALWLVKTDVQTGLAMVGLKDNTIILYRGATDPYWNYVRIRIWKIKTTP